MTNQETFDKVVNHLATQNKKAQSEFVNPFTDFYLELNKDLLHQLQGIHDHSSDPEYWKEGLENLAYHFNLQFNWGKE